ncbi:MAG: hypothetical protein KGJ13_06280 [Patescibacteria group bacterium]|nr:hypothetical protein [Patescibacteria group bacterium]
MPYALLLIGAIMLVAGLRNTYAQLWKLVEGDFTSQGGFLSWVAAIAVVGGLGYIPKLRPLSIAFMTLLLVVLVLSNGGVFAKLQAFIQSGAQPSGGQPLTTQPNGNIQTPSTVSPSLSPLDQINNNLTGGFNG